MLKYTLANKSKQKYTTKKDFPQSLPKSTHYKFGRLKNSANLEAKLECYIKFM